MGIKLIASDMDGTLLNDNVSDARSITQFTQRERRCGFYNCNGRMYCSVEPFAVQLGLDVPLITYNGALVKEACPRRCCLTCRWRKQRLRAS